MVPFLSWCSDVPVMFSLFSLFHRCSQLVVLSFFFFFFFSFFRCVVLDYTLECSLIWAVFQISFVFLVLLYN